MCKEDYINFELAKLLKDKGFCEWCSKCYGVAVLHNGVEIDLDEEYELKAEGRENEIEYVEGGMLHDHSYNNFDKDAKIWAAPTLWAAMKWLREVHNIFIQVELYKYDDYCFEVFQNTHRLIVEKDDVYNSYEEAVEAAIKYCLKHLI